MANSRRLNIQKEDASAIEALFSKYLTKERGLTAATVHTYWWYVHSFLGHCGARDESDLARIERSHVDEFVDATARRVSLRGVQITIASLRAFLRFAFLAGFAKTNLAGAVLPARSWRHAQVPRFIPADSVERILDSCDSATARGRQDHAVLLLLGRLGLRPKEIQGLLLDDINWKRGELLVRGKGLQHDWLPLPHDVGKALACHLRTSSARSSRHVFVTSAPRGAKPYATSSFVVDALHAALTRTGIQAPARWIGASLLRHSLATSMLGKGASLQEIGGVLRHRWAQTTEIYAKVDIDGLSSIARPWPVEVRS